MEKRPTLEEVKKYFKDAETVECLYDKEPHDISNQIMDISRFEKEWWLDTSEDRRVNIQLWTPEKGYAKILTYKEKQMKISKENIIKLDKKETTARELLPSLFAPVLEKLKWHKKYGALCFIEEHLEDKDFIGYGFCPNGKWIISGSDNWTCDHSGWTEATESEVFEALKGEAVRRGYKYGNYKCLLVPECTHKVRDSYHLNGNTLFHGENEESANNVVFEDGVWAEIIPVKEMTQSQIENELGYKIKIV